MASPVRLRLQGGTFAYFRQANERPKGGKVASFIVWSCVLVRVSIVVWVLTVYDCVSHQTDKARAAREERRERRGHGRDEDRDGHLQGKGSGGNPNLPPAATSLPISVGVSGGSILPVHEQISPAGVFKVVL